MPSDPDVDDQLLVAMQRLGDLLEDTRGMLGLLADRVADLAAADPAAPPAPASASPAPRSDSPVRGPRTSSAPAGPVAPSQPIAAPAPAAVSPRRTPPAPVEATEPADGEAGRPIPPAVIADHLHGVVPEPAPEAPEASPAAPAPTSRPRPASRRAALPHRDPHPAAPAVLADHLRTPAELAAEAEDGAAPGDPAAG